MIKGLVVRLGLMDGLLSRWIKEICGRKAEEEGQAEKVKGVQEKI